MTTRTDVGITPSTNVSNKPKLGYDDTLPSIIRPASPIAGSQYNTYRKNFFQGIVSQMVNNVDRPEELTLEYVDEGLDHSSANLDPDSIRAECRLLRTLMDTERDVANKVCNNAVEAIDRILSEAATAMPQELILLYSVNLSDNSLGVLGCTMEKLHGITIRPQNSEPVGKSPYFWPSMEKKTNFSYVDGKANYTSKSVYGIPIYGPNDAIIAILEVRASHNVDHMWTTIKRLLSGPLSSLNHILQHFCRKRIQALKSNAMSHEYQTLLAQTAEDCNLPQLLSITANMVSADYGAFFEVGNSLEQKMIYKSGSVTMKNFILPHLDQCPNVSKWLQESNSSILENLSTQETNRFAKFIDIPAVRAMVALCFTNVDGGKGLFCFFKFHSKFDLNEILIASLSQVTLKMSQDIKLLQHNAKDNSSNHLSKMYHTIISASKARTGSDFITAITSMGCDVFDAERVTLYMFDQIKQELWCLSTHGDVNGIRIPLGTGIAGQVAESKKKIVVDDVYKDPRFDQSVDKYTGFRTRSMIAIPIIDERQNLVGVLQAINRIPTQTSPHAKFMPDDVELIELFCVELKWLINEKRSLLQLTKTYVDMNVTGSMAINNSDGEDDDQITHQLQNVKAINSLLQESSEYRDHRSAAKSSIPYVLLAVGKFKKCLQRKSARYGSFISPKIDDASTAVLCNTELTHSINLGTHSMDGCDMRDILDLGFDLFTKTEEQLKWYVVGMFEVLGLLSYFRVHFEAVLTFADRLLSSYRENPYHNSHHAFSVMHVVYTLIRKSPVRNILTSLDIFGVLIAALGHDADHPGHDNHTEILSYSQLAMIYNDISVLENHHAAVTFSILRGRLLAERIQNRKLIHLDMNCCILEELSVAAQRQIRESIVSCILATDMKHHSEVLEKLSKKPTLEAFQSHVLPDRQLLMNVLVHSADLSSQALPLKISLQWTDRICEEFQLQAAIFREKNWHVPPHMVDLEDHKTRMRLQMNFIDYLVNPLWGALGHILLDGAEEFITNLKNNRAYFAEQEQLEQKKSDKA